MSDIAVAYARYSTSLQQETSIAAQIEGIAAYCVRSGITLLPKHYIDEAYSGTNLNRPGFSALLRDAQTGLFNAVVVYDVSRGSRDVADWFSFRKQMQALNIKVLSVTNTLGSPDDPDSYLMELLSVGIGQHQVLQSRQKSIAGKRVSAERGLFCGGNAPLGYTIVDQHYVIEPIEAATVKMIFEMYAGGASYSDIEAAVQARGIRGRLGQQITGNTLYYILKNEKYTGTYTWFERENRHMHKWVGRPGEAPIVIENSIPAIIDKATWEAVRMRMLENKHNKFNKSRPDREYLLSGLVFCEDCGAPMIGITTISKGHEYKRYTCQNKRKFHFCRMKDIRGDHLEQRAFEIVRDRLFAPATIELVADMIIDNMAKKTADTSAISEELKSVTTKLSNVVEAIVNGTTSGPIIKLSNDLDARRNELQAQLAAARIESPDIPSRESLIEALHACAEKFISRPDLRKQLFRQYIVAIVVGKEEIEFQLAPLALLEKAQKNGHKPVKVSDHEWLLR